MPRIGLPPVVQYFPRDYSTKTSDSEGGTSRGGYLRYEILWTRMDQAQNAVLQRILAEVGKGDLYFTGTWWDTSNPVIRWVDLKGKPDLTDPTPNPPASSYGVQVFSTLKLSLNNVVLVTDPAVY